MQSIWNVVVAASNAMAILPLRMSLKNNDYITFGSLAFVAMASFVSHLFASHKHGPKGFGCSHFISRALNDLDLLGVFVLTSRLVYLYATTNSKLAILKVLGPPLLSCGIVNIASEMREMKGVAYALLHSLWHVLIFTWVAGFLNAS
jgi:hypothetical protein